MTADPCPWCGDEAVMDPEKLFPDGNGIICLDHEAIQDTRCESCRRKVWVERVVDVRYLVKKFGSHADPDARFS